MDRPIYTAACYRAIGNGITHVICISDINLFAGAQRGEILITSYRNALCTYGRAVLLYYLIASMLHFLQSKST